MTPLGVRRSRTWPPMAWRRRSTSKSRPATSSLASWPAARSAI
jgi:hypothetical protein